MKHFYLLTIIFLFYGISFAQYFPGKDVQLLLDQDVKPKENDDFKKYGYYNFYADKSLSKRYNIGDVTTDYNSVSGKKFKIISIDKKGYDEFVLTLKSDDQNIIFYKYESDKDYSFELDVISKIQYPEGYFCDKINIEKDKFEGTELYRTPKAERIVFTKEKNKISMFLYADSATLYDLNNEVTILFLDGSKIKKQAKINRSVAYNSNYSYSVIFTLSEIDLKKMTSIPITDYKISGAVSRTDKGNLFKELLKCLVNKK